MHTTKVPTYPSGQIGAFMARKSGGKGDSTGNQRHKLQLLSIKFNGLV